MTMVRMAPSPLGGGLTLPSYPWTPDVIEEMPEEERLAYLQILREATNKLLDKK